MHRILPSLILFCATFVAPPTAALADPITVPPCLHPGEQYRLAFVTSTVRDATSPNIADYNAFVTAAANSVPELAALGTTWKAIGSTSTVDARDNTGTNPNSSVGLPIYRLDGGLIASTNQFLWEIGLRIPLDITEAGPLAPPMDGQVLTGTYSNGTRSLKILWVPESTQPSGTIPKPGRLFGSRPP
jgi:hypothetical protein